MTDEEVEEMRARITAANEGLRTAKEALDTGAPLDAHESARRISRMYPDLPSHKVLHALQCARALGWLPPSELPEHERLVRAEVAEENSEARAVAEAWQQAALTGTIPYAIPKLAVARVCADILDGASPEEILRRHVPPEDRP